MMFGMRMSAVLSIVAVVAVLLLAACAATSGVPAASITASAMANPATSAMAVAPTPTPQPTPTPREEPPAVAAEPVAMAAQIVVAERAVRDRGVIGAELAWTGHLQQRIYRALAARPELREAFLAAVPAEIRGTVTANLDATSELRATVVPGPNLPTWRASIARRRPSSVCPGRIWRRSTSWRRAWVGSGERPSPAHRVRCSSCRGRGPRTAKAT
jgi:hypothetical protein